MSLQPSSPAVPTQRKGRFHGASINLFYLPVIILLVVFIVYPLVNGFFLSLTNWDGYSPDKSFVGRSITSSSSKTRISSLCWLIRWFTASVQPSSSRFSAWD